MRKENLSILSYDPNRVRISDIDTVNVEISELSDIQQILNRRFIMKDGNKSMNAEVIAVYPNKVKISVDDLSKFVSTDEQVEKLKVGSYLEIADDDNHKLIAIIESYSIVIDEKKPSIRCLYYRSKSSGDN